MASPVNIVDETWMRRALACAQAAEELGEVPVGAVLVDAQGELLAATGNSPVRDCDPTAHAEVCCLRAAGQVAKNYRFPGSTLYVTLEPCIMCAGAIIHARVGRVVFGAYDPKAGAAGSHNDVLLRAGLNHQPLVEGGLLEPECSALLRNFFRRRRKG